MYRRVLLQLMGSFVGSILYGRALPARRRDGPLVVSFFVAGVRFQAPRSTAAVGDRVTISAATFQGSRCYEVLAGQSRIGYVPRDIIGKLPALPRLSGVISAVHVNALPWKRVEVSLRI